jgi:ubiquinol-cytochrome c reductase subunit 8
MPRPRWSQILTDRILPGCPTPQRIASYSLSSNRQRPFAGAFNAAIFNSFRRFRHQVLYVVPPFIAAYAAMNWAVER